METRQSIAYFISPHGFGHASRSAAILQVLHTLAPDHEVHIFTRVPRWFFDTALRFPYHFHECQTDIGLVQSTPLEEDLPATLNRLSSFIPFQPSQIDSIAAELRHYQCRLAICDISPLGIAAAHAANLPAVLVENFTWDWIYAGYLAREPGFEPFIAKFKQVFRSADAHIQMLPVCSPDAQASLVTNPIARPPRTSKATIRQELQIPYSASVVLLTMGGFELKYDFLDGVPADRDIWFVVPGGAPEMRVSRNLVLIPHHSQFYHPDLVHASDAVISKAGYSTIAEVYYAGIPFGYVTRDSFRESPVLSAFIQREMQGLAIDGATFQSGNWVRQIPALLQLGRIERTNPLGAVQAAEFLYENYLRPSW
jgi:hypothetical protein